MNDLYENPPVWDTMPDGKQKLILAALRIAARDGVTLQTLKLRELAREADLNHNTFYRHFDNLEALAEATIETIAYQMVVGMKQIRMKAKNHADATVGVIEYFLDLVMLSPDAFVVGVRELHNATSFIRPLLNRVLDDIAHESVTQITELKLVPINNPNLLFRVARDITHYMFCKSIEIIKKPESKKELTTEMVRFVRRQFLGEIALMGMSDESKTN
jgi:TetR/AcrR family transcriptional regulator, fatty acid biosynthesis regulator